MSIRTSQKNRAEVGGKSCLNLSLWKHLAKNWALPTSSVFWIFTWAHSVPRTHQTLGPLLPLPKRMWFPGANLHLSVPFAAAICLAWETANSSLTIPLPLWGWMSQIIQPRSSPRVGLYSTGSAESQKLDLILNKHANVIEIHVFFFPKTKQHFTHIVGLNAFGRPRKSWVVP